MKPGLTIFLSLLLVFAVAFSAAADPDNDATSVAGPPGDDPDESDDELVDDEDEDEEPSSSRNFAGSVQLDYLALQLSQSVETLRSTARRSSSRSSSRWTLASTFHRRSRFALRVTGSRSVWPTSTSGLATV